MATRLATRPRIKKPSGARSSAPALRQRRFTTLMGFTLEAEPMPDDSSETLYTLTHPDIPGMVVGDSDPWQAVLSGLEAARQLLRQEMEAGEPLRMNARK